MRSVHDKIGRVSPELPRLLEYPKVTHNDTQAILPFYSHP
jgi:hypothetical protein